MSQQSIHDRIMSRKIHDTIQSKDKARGGPKWKWLRTGTLCLFGIAVAAAAGYVAMRNDTIGNLLTLPAIAETNETGPASADTPFVKHANQAGLQSCSGVFPTLGAMLTNGSEYGVQSMWNTQTPDKHAVRALVGMNYATQGYSGPAAGVVVAAPTGSLCEGSMIRVAPFAASCTDMPAMLPKGSKLTNVLAQISIYELPNSGGNAMLLPTGNNCVVISVASATGKQRGGK